MPFAAAAILGGATRRQLAVATVFPFVMNWTFQGAALGSGIVALGSALFIVVGHGVLCWLFFRPIWASAQQFPENRRRLFWKVRNLFLFLIGVLTVSAFTTLGVFTPTISSIVVNYVDFLLRVGFAAFLFANVDVFREFDHGDVTGRELRETVAAG